MASNSGGSDGLVHRGLETESLSDNKIHAARKFLYESSDDESFHNGMGDDDFPVNVSASMPQHKRASFIGRHTGTNLSGGKFGNNNNGESRSRRFVNTLKYHGIPQRLKQICVILGLVLALTACAVYIDQSRKNKTGIFKNSGKSNDDESKSSNTQKHKLHGKRIERFHQMFLDMEVSSQDDLDTPGTAQHSALEWVANSDGAKLRADDHLAMERYILAVLYYTTAGTDDQEAPSESGHWQDATHWLTKSGICNWHGVTCAGDAPNDTDDNRSHHHGLVERLELAELGLMGSIPSELGFLTKLYRLDLSSNDLAGSLPKSLGRLTGLRELELSHNMIEGTIPEHYGNELTNLHHLLLGENKLVGTIPYQIEAMVELRSLSLKDNELTGTVPDLQDLTKIRQLILEDNQLEGPFPTSVAKLTSLVHLDLGRNHLTGTLPEDLTKLTALEKLLLREMNLRGKIPPELFNKVTRLTELGLSNNKLTGTIPTNVGHLKDLHEFYLGQNQLKGSIPRQVGLMADLNILELQGNSLSGSIPNLVSALNGLELFSVARNHITGTIPPEVGQMHRLQSLMLEHNKLTGGVPTELGNLRTLKQVRLYENHLEGNIPREVCELTIDEELTFLGADCGHKFTCDCCTKCF